MCGRFTLAKTPDDVRTLFDLPPLPPSPDPGLTDRPRYNVAPTQPILVMTVRDGGRAGQWMCWSFAPPQPGRPPLINARTETVFERGAFARAVRTRRCAVAADGFFEWARVGKTKQPYHVKPSGGGTWLFAGIWTHWKSGERGVAILTVPANDAVAPLHDRMPLVLPPDALDRWIDPRPVERDDLDALLHPGGEGRVDLVPVNRKVGNVANDDPTCVERVEPLVGPGAEREPARPGADGASQLGFDW